MKIPKIKDHIKRYNQEKFIFEDIGPKARSRGFLKFDEFYKICMWKSSRQKPRYLRNKGKIENISKKSFQEEDEEKKIELLCSLSGVAIPTASAILTIVFPKNYAIIDIRCIEILRHLGFKLSKVMAVKNWLNYLSITRKLAEENNVTPREVDMALFAMHREKLELEGFKNLYGDRK